MKMKINRGRKENTKGRTKIEQTNTNGLISLDRLEVHLKKR
jgi:hypothetical protein